MKTKGVVLGEGQSLRVKLPFEAHGGVCVIREAGESPSDHDGRPALYKEAGLLCKDLLAVPGIRRLSFRRDMLTIELSPACNAVDYRPHIEKYMERITSSTVRLEEAREALFRCNFIHTAHPAIAVEESAHGREVVLWFMRQISRRPYGIVPKRRTPYDRRNIRESELLSRELYDCFRKIARMDEVSTMEVTPYSAALNLRSAVTSTRLIEIVAWIKAVPVLYTPATAAEIKTVIVAPPRFSAKEIRDSKNFGRYRDHS